jgi:hypothetical protein
MSIRNGDFCRKPARRPTYIGQSVERKGRYGWLWPSAVQRLHYAMSVAGES